VYRRHVAAADQQFLEAAGRFRAGELSPEALSAMVCELLSSCSQRACAARPGAARPLQEAPWFDDECRQCKLDFVRKWSEYLAMGGPATVPADDPVSVAAHDARRAWRRLKNWHKKEYNRLQEEQLLNTFYLGQQRLAWRILRGQGQHTNLDPDVSAWTAEFKRTYGEPVSPLHLSPEHEAVKQELRARHVHDGGEAAQQLCEEVDDVELVRAVGKLRCGKGHDAAGLTCELLRYAVCDVGAPSAALQSGVPQVPDVPYQGPASAALVDCLVCLVNSIPDAQQYPANMALAKLVPVPKKGCTTTDRSTYRGIALTGILGQLYDCILHVRMEKYVEDRHLRAPVQCGFRRRHGTLDAMFVMAHLISKHKYINKPLYVCYVDFRKAFDMVRREEVLSRGSQLGIHGAFLRALEKWLLNSMLSVSVNGVQGEPFATHRGTKQGGRLSPLCFGLFIEQLHELIQMRVPGAGPYVDGLRVPDIMYADDIKLIAGDPDQLQQLLDVLHLFCILFDMQVNVSPHKTCIVVHGGGDAELREWHLGEQVVPVCESYTDLGLVCTPAQGYAAGANALAVSGRKAMHAVLSMCKRGHVAQPRFKLRLFDALVEPVLSYGCQVWGPWVWNLQDPLKGGAESVHIDYMRIMAGVGRCVKHQLLLHDFARFPIAYHWVALAVRWWCTLTAEDNKDKLAAKTLRSDVWFMVSGCTDCWSYKLLNTLTVLGILDRNRWDRTVNAAIRVTDVLALQLSEKQVKEQLRRKFDADMHSMHANTQLMRKGPRHPDCTSSQVMLLTYLSYVRARDLDKKPPHLLCRRLSFAEVQTLCRYRLGWHDLRVQSGRYTRVDRQQRVCTLCTNQVHGHPVNAAPVEDLLHFLLECPALQHVRDKYPELFLPQYIDQPEADVHARYILNHSDQRLVAEVLQGLQSAREEVKAGQQPRAATSPSTIVLSRFSAWLAFRRLPRAEQTLYKGWY
jgi:hypothetical protein